MLLRDFSQVPVLKNEQRELVGTVTWRSLSENPTATTAGQAVERGAVVANHSDDLLSVVPKIIDSSFIYYLDPKRRVKGILTSSDLAQVFLDTTGSYLKLGEIESRLRSLLDTLPIPDLEKGLDPKIAHSPSFNGATDMTFGEYVRTMQRDDVWRALSLNLDQKVCVANLEVVREARNSLMHFHAEGLEEDQAESIDMCLRWLRSVTS